MKLIGWALAWVLLCTCGSIEEVHGVTHQDDVNGLLALQDAWGAHGILRWTGNDPCAAPWPQIVCNNSNPQRVISLVVPGLSLSGQLPDDVGLLTALQTLDLSFNNLSGKLPSQLGKLTNLGNLLLQSNKFSGSIPPELGNLLLVRYLYLNDNLLQGTIPHEFGFLKNLYWLDLAGNGLQGELPYASDGKNELNVGLDNLTTTRHFHFNNNSLQGSIPSAICHPNMALIHMLFDSNQLSGNIPETIGQCTDLTILKLDNNKLTGAIPENVSQLVNLTELYLSNNQLTSVPTDLSSLSNLNVLGLGNNPLEEAKFPTWLPSLKGLTDLNMQGANIIGPIPKIFFELPSLAAAKLDDNSINGTLDLSTSTQQLLYVSVTQNSIDSTYLGVYNHELHLEGNPVCNTSAFLNSPVCNEAPTITSVSFQSSTNCSTSCPPDLAANPMDCSCAVPFKGLFTYRAPSFTTLSNLEHLRTFVSTVASKLNISQRQIMVPNAAFNNQGQLLVTAWIFPNGTTRWSADDIVRISSATGNIFPLMFGPPMFQPESYPFESASNTQTGKLSKGTKVGIGVGVAGFLLILLAVSIYATLQKVQLNRQKRLRDTYPSSWGSSKADSGDGPKLKGARWFSYAELKKATNNFSEANEIGSGGYGKVYKGELLTKEKVAIKRADQRSMQGVVEFKNEIELLSRVHHRNVVSLVGFCFEQGEQMLVYDFMENGTVRDALFGYSGVNLDWHRRLSIALGAAQGLTYLHELASPSIIHRDIKSSNILLDGKLQAKVADFGLSKIGPDAGKDHITTQVKGTVGYLDPEYYLTQQLTEKSDVYSYGVVLLELLTARQPIEHGKYIVREVKALLDKGGMAALRPVLDPRLQHENMVEVQKYVQIALTCVEESALDRPTMSELAKDFEALLGQEIGEGAGSSKMSDYGAARINKRRFSDSDCTYSSQNSSCDSSFHCSGHHAAPSIWPK